MRVVVEASTWRNARGFGRYTRSLVGRLIEADADSEYVLLFDGPVPDDLRLPSHARAVAVPTSAPFDPTRSHRGQRAWRDLWRMSAATRRESPDVVFFPSVDFYHPLRPPAPPAIVTVHDAIPERPDLVRLSRAARWRRRIKLRVAFRQASRIAVISEFARRDICRCYGLARARTVLVPAGVSDDFRPPADPAAARAAAERLGARPPYLLFVGGGGAHKNVGGTIAAFARVARRADLPSAGLVMVGPDPDGAHARDIAGLAARHGVADRVVDLGFVEDRDLAVLYQAAEALVLPSLAEGLGLPGIEAAACGTPAVVTRQSPLPELLGAAAEVVDPRSIDDVARGLAVALGDAAARARMRTAARALAGAFSWSLAADRLHATLVEVAGSRRRRPAGPPRGPHSARG